MAASDNGITAEGLVKDFKKGPRAVDGIDLTVAPGEIYGFLGPNGAGKSTTVLILTTLLPPTSGRAVVAGYDVVRDGPKVRRAIGAALQEAALDPLLTGRDHMRLQTSLHGIPRAERRRRGDQLLDRVGLGEAADRKVSGYSGGMKRRLDLALALVHGPRILFLDEPTTGLDPQSRAALWEEVARLARDDGVTVFLTTQYLEEADVLADRVGIIDHGHIVAEGTPADLKAQIGRPTVHVVPADPGQRARFAAVLTQFGESARNTPNGVSVRLANREDGLADVVRALDGESLQVADLELHAPSLDDVFLEKTGRTLEGAAEEAETDGVPAGLGVTGGFATHVAQLGRRSVVRTLRQPANIVFSLAFPLMLLAVNAGGLEPATELPGFPSDTFLAFALAVPFIQGALFATMNAGTDLARDIQTGFLNRLGLTPMRGAALIAGQLAGVAALGLLQAMVYLGVGLLVGVQMASGVPGALVLILLSGLYALGFGAVGTFMALRTGSGESIQGLFPVLFVFLLISSMNMPRNLIEVDWFRFAASINPVSYMVEAVRSLIIEGWNVQALALGFGFATILLIVGITASAASLATRLTRT